MVSCNASTLWSFEVTDIKNEKYSIVPVYTDQHLYQMEAAQNVKFIPSITKRQCGTDDTSIRMKIKIDSLHKHM